MSPGRRRALYGILGCGGLLGVLTCTGVGLLSSAAGGRWVANRLEGALSNEHTEVSVGEVKLDLTRGHVRVEDFSLHTESLELDLGRVDARLDYTALASGTIKLVDGRADGANVVVRVVEPDPNDPPAEPFAGLGVHLLLPDVEVHGAQVSYQLSDGSEVVRVVGATGTVDFEAVDDKIRVDDADLTAMVGLSGATVAHVTGSVEINPAGTFLEDLDVVLPQSRLGIDGSIEDELSLAIDAEKLDVREVDQLLGNPGLDGRFTGQVSLSGPSDQLKWKAELDGIEGTAGRVRATGHVDNTGEKLGWGVDANLEGVDANELYPGIGDKVGLTGRAVVDGTGTSWPDDLEMTVDWDGTAHDVFGQKIEGAKARVRLADGKVTLENTTIDGILGELDVSGEIDPEGPMDLHVTGWIRPSRLRELGVSGVDSSGWIDARIHKDAGDDAPIEVGGTATFAPFRSGDSVVFERVVARYDIDVVGEKVDGRARAVATGGDVGGVAIAEAEAPEIEIHQGPGRLSVGGPVVVRQVDLPGTFGASEIAGTWGMEDDVLTAEVRLADPSVLKIAGTQGQVSVRMKGDRVDLDTRIEATDRSLVDVGGRFDLAESELVLDRLGFAPAATSHWIASRPVRFRLSEGGLADADIALASEHGEVELTGTVGTVGPLDAAIALRRMDLQALGAIDPEAYAGAKGIVDLELSLAGHAKQPEIEGSVNAVGIHWPEQVADLDVEGSVGATVDQLRTTLRIAVADTPLARVEGHLPVSLDLADPKLDPDGDVDLHLVLAPGPLSRISKASPAAGDLPKGRASGVFEIQGKLVDPDLRLAGVGEIQVEHWPDPARTEFELTRTDGALAGWIDARHNHEAVAQAFTAGTVRLEEALRPALVDGAMPEDFVASSLVDDLIVSGVVLEMPAELLAAAAGLDDLDVRGAMIGGFTVGGQPETPEVSASLNWVDGRIGRQRIEAMDLRLDPTESGYDLDLLLDFRRDGLLTVKGPIPMRVDFTRDSTEWATGEMNLQLGGPGVPLRTLTAMDLGLSKIQGLLALDGHVGGTVFDPDPQVSLAISGGAADVHELGLRVHDLTLAAQASMDAFDFELAGITEPLRARIDLQEGIEQVGKVVEEIDPLADDEERPESSFFARGNVLMEDGTPTEVKGRVRLDKGTWVIATSDTQVQVDGKVRVAGTWPALVVGGDLTLRDARVALDAAAFVDQAPLEPDPRILILRSDGALRLEEEEVPPWYTDVTASVEIDLRRAVELDVSMPFVDDLGSLGAFVSKADLFARIGGAATLTMVDGEPTMVGDIEVNEGRLKMLGRRFDVESGMIRFTGGDIAEPNLSINARTTVAQIPITANVAGTPSGPTFTTACEGYPSESDCLMVILSGRAPDAGGSEDDGPSTEAMLARLAIGQLLGQQDVADFVIEPDGTLQVGASLANSVYFTYTFDPTADVAENTNTGEFDIGLSRRVVWNIGVGDRKSWTDLFWELRF